MDCSSGMQSASAALEPDLYVAPPPNSLAIPSSARLDLGSDRSLSHFALHGYNPLVGWGRGGLATLHILDLLLLGLLLLMELKKLEMVVDQSPDLAQKRLLLHADLAQ